jgi:hypothetical protein
MRTRVGTAALAVALLAGLAATPAPAASYDIDWTGTLGRSLTGSFSFDDSLLGTTIEAGDLDSFMIEVFFGSTSLAAWDFFADGVQPGATMNFNFDSATGQFLVGGNSSSATGQDWNSTGGSGCGDFAGFTSGSASQAVCFQNSPSGFLGIGLSTLTATPKTGVIPLPASALLLLSGLAGLAALRRRPA